MTNRLERLVREMENQQMDSLLVTSTPNFYYLSNYYTDPHERVIAVYVSKGLDPVMILPAMEKPDAEAAGWSFDIIAYQDHEDPWQLFASYLKKQEKRPSSLGLEYDHLSLERFEAIKQVLPDTHFSDAKGILAELRVIKNKKEYILLKEAASLADIGIETGIRSIKEGITELELIANIEYELKRHGVRQMSFSTMALSGSKTASPHGTPSSKKIMPGDLVMFDLGVVFEGYCSDITRTVAYRSISDEQRQIYETVREAEEKAVKKAEIGLPAGELDHIARAHIDNAGYGKYFNHRIGHGLGIETHEYPSMHGNNRLPLKEGMCYTIEPGIYKPGSGGVRIEDMVFLTGKGPECLTEYPRDLQIIE
ncbi:M24 family metallopeptidase [Virgibacillus xinjiangensis]|uniref:M24 family metallopeptidase n=1 Tax=Virgibacillus xinjiangensis TaxID=393090 RepID=A0ABV7CUW4_9BACI